MTATCLPLKSSLGAYGWKSTPAGH